METATTAGIRVSVETMYQTMHSRPAMHEYVYAYRITIENLSSEAVQLMRRHWYIWDSDGSLREVEGEGVVGEQPVLQPGDRHQYISGCPLRTDMGRMQGTYQMRRLSDGSLFDVQVPVFQLIAPFKGN